MKRCAAVLAALLLFGCDPVVRRIVTLTFDPTAEHVTISAATFLGSSREADDERSALLAERDEWSVRFAQANPESERVVLQRSHGKLDSVEHSATIAVDQLQKFFFDTPLTVTVTRGDGWSELALYAGSSMRANAEQRRAAERILTTYSARAVHYFNAVGTMYAYLDEKPRRAADLFTDVFSGENEIRPLLSERERAITDEVRQSADALLAADEPAAVAMDRTLDLVYNPFPAKLRVVIHGEPLAVEGFARVSSETFEVRTVTALEAVTALEGRWVSPDPLALALNTNDKKTAAELASMIDSAPRHAGSFVTESEVANALLEKMRPAPRYRLRWTTKPQSPAS